MDFPTSDISKKPILQLQVFMMFHVCFFRFHQDFHPTSCFHGFSHHILQVSSEFSSFYTSTSKSPGFSRFVLSFHENYHLKLLVVVRGLEATQLITAQDSPGGAQGSKALLRRGGICGSFPSHIHYNVCIYIYLCVCMCTYIYILYIYI